MSAQDIYFYGVIVAFGVFMVTLLGVSVWVNLKR